MAEKRGIEILYRVYRVKGREEAKIIEEGQEYWRFNDSEREEMVTQDAMVCESREKFKELIKEMYGEGVKFRASRQYTEGQIYCVIIGELAYDGERYFNTVEYECAQCGKKVKGSYRCGNKISEWDIRRNLGGDFDRYNKLNFCSGQCMQNFYNKERLKYADEFGGENCWIERGDFARPGIVGCIYKISKKGSGEFYVGQTIHNPIFRWGQHLKGGRFDIEDIEDYKFEVLEIVRRGGNILEREKHWIQKCYREAPEKSLNIMCTAGLEQFKMEEVQ